MSMEQVSPRPEDIEVAMTLINESEILRNDQRSKDLVENGGMTIDGRKVDIGNFLAAREAYLKLNSVKDKDPIAYEEAMVVHSVRPDQEKAWVN
jgi:hypothetical protein